LLKARDSSTETPAPFSKSTQKVTEEKPRESDMSSGDISFAISFSTAGTGRAINVCEESLMKAKQLFDSNASSGKATVSYMAKSEGMNRISKVKGSNSNVTIGDVVFGANMSSPIETLIPSVGKTMAKDKVREERSTDSNMGTCNTPFAATFSTAGKKAPIHVCEDSLARANQLLKARDSSTETPAPFSKSTQKVTEEKPRESDMSSGDISFAISFSTAGTGRAINVCEESLMKAKQLFDSNASSGKATVSYMAKSEGMNRISKVKASNSNMAIGDVAFAVSVSAGDKRKHENLSEESLVTKRQIRGEAAALMDMSGIYSEMSETVEKIIEDKSADSNFNVCNTPSILPLNRSINEGPINSDEESLIKAKRLFDRNTVLAGIAGSVVDNSLVVSTLSAEEAETLTAGKSAALFPLPFSTTDIRNPIARGGESIMKAKRLFDKDSTLEENSGSCLQEADASDRMMEEKSHDAIISIGNNSYRAAFSKIEKQNPINTFEERRCKPHRLVDEESIVAATPSARMSIAVDRTSGDKSNMTPHSHTYAIALSTSGQGKEIHAQDYHRVRENPIFDRDIDLAKTPVASLDKAEVIDNIKQDDATKPDTNKGNSLDSVAFHLPRKGEAATICEGSGAEAKGLLFESSNQGEVCAMEKAKRDSSERKFRLICSQVRPGKSGLRKFNRKKVAKLMNNSVQTCMEHGVSIAATQVTSINATNLNFSSATGGAEFWVDASRDYPPGTHVDMIKRCREALITKGCDRSKLYDQWILNHARWIIWKLAAIERRFPFLSGKFFNFTCFIKHLKGRYDKEILAGQRSALRKILNKDVTPSSLLILCVAQVLSCPKRDDDTKELRRESKELALELTDGWYGVKAILDPLLGSKVEKGVIKVGTKLAFSNASLVGAGEGVDPLDNSYNSANSESTIYFVLSSNATRLATWDSRLGFVDPSNSLITRHGTLLCRNIKDIVLGGGLIPCINLTICRVFPKLYYERQGPGTLSEVATPSQVLSENQEFLRSARFEEQKTKSAEKILESIQDNCAKVRFMVLAGTVSSFTLLQSINPITGS